jgi:23S rRNA (uracil1939-C5)-methyltransferase
MMPEELFELTLTDIANGGQAIGRHAGKTIFVPFTIPGEEITARIVDDRGRFAFAEGVQLLAPSVDRVQPRCPHFGPGKCGGCHWQHMDYSAQLALKTDIVLDQLERIGRFEDAPVEMAIPSPNEWHYRHEAVLLPVPGGGLGFKAQIGAGGYPIQECHIITPDLLNLLPLLDFDLPTLREVILRENGAGDQMLILGTTDDDPPALELDFPASVNFLLSDGEPANLIGSTHLVHTLLGRPYRVTAGSFLRPQNAQTERLMLLVRDWLQGAANVLDVYCGVGILAGAFAEDVASITCLDAYPPSVLDASENLRDFSNVEVLEAEAAEFLNQGSKSYEAIILDPPAEGLGVALIDALENQLPPRLIYIGEDPAILARDIRRLSERYGYQLRIVQPLDFEPQTFRIVSAAYLERGS